VPEIVHHDIARRLNSTSPRKGWLRNSGRSRRKRQALDVDLSIEALSVDDDDSKSRERGSILRCPQKLRHHMAFLPSYAGVAPYLPTLYVKRESYSEQMKIFIVS
jgi:hypothetical protein